MTEENLPDEELTVIDEDPEIPDEGMDAVSPDTLDPLADSSPDDYPGAAEENPDRWQEDPLLSGEAASVSGLPETDQELRDETEEERYRDGDEQIPPEEPTLGEAAEDVDFGETTDPDQVDASDDPANRGGSPLSEFEPEDLDR